VVAVAVGCHATCTAEENQVSDDGGDLLLDTQHSTGRSRCSQLLHLGFA
jgi:hypothetical protein